MEVSAQGEQMDEVEEGLIQADEATAEGVGELGEARKIQSKTRTTKSVLAGAGSCALTFGVAGVWERERPLIPALRIRVMPHHTATRA